MRSNILNCFQSVLLTHPSRFLGLLASWCWPVTVSYTWSLIRRHHITQLKRSIPTDNGHFHFCYRRSNSLALCYQMTLHHNGDKPSTKLISLAIFDPSQRRPVHLFWEGVCPTVNGRHETQEIPLVLWIPDLRATAYISHKHKSVFGGAIKWMLLTSDRLIAIVTTFNYQIIVAPTRQSQINQASGPTVSATL